SRSWNGEKVPCFFSSSERSKMLARKSRAFFALSASCCANFSLFSASLRLFSASLRAATRLPDSTASDTSASSTTPSSPARRPPPPPFPGALQRPHRPRPDRPPRLETAQVVGQLLGTGIAPGRLLAQALQADRLQVRRHLRTPSRRRHRLVVQHAHQHDVLRPLERRPAHQALVQQGAQRGHVRRRPPIPDLARRPRR